MSRVEGLTPTSTGIASTLKFENVNVPVGIFYQQGYIKVSADGLYIFTVKGDDGFLLRLHDAVVVDGSYNGHAGNRASGSIQLQTGYHPFRLYYRQPLAGKAALSLFWNKAGEQSQAIDPQYLFH